MTNKIEDNRFKQLLDALNLSPNAFAKELGYDRAEKVYNFYNGKYNPSFEVLQDITKKFGDVDLNWLISGCGEMFKNVRPECLSKMSVQNDQIVRPDVRLIGNLDTSCQRCADKERIITQQQTAIDALRETIGVLKERITVISAHLKHCKQIDDDNNEEVWAQEKKGL